MRACVDRRQGHLSYGAMAGLDLPEGRGTIDRSVGVGNGRFLGYVANGMSRAELEERFKAGEFPDLHRELAKDATQQAGMGTREHVPVPNTPPKLKEA